MQTMSSSTDVRPPRRPSPLPHPAEKIEESLLMVPPVWPLQNNVAVNPFWFLRHYRFDALVARQRQVHGINIIMPLEYYQERLSRGEISPKAVRDAIHLLQRENPQQFGSQFFSIDEASVQSPPAPSVSPVQTVAEFVSPEIHSDVVAECSKHAAAYLDERQAHSPYPWASLPFWEAWHRAQSLDSSMEFLGFSGFRETARKLAGLDAPAAIQTMLDAMGVPQGSARVVYLERLALSVLGWATQFRYLEWQRSLGYAVHSQGTLRDLIAVRLCYDYGIMSLAPHGTVDIEAWKAQWANMDRAASGAESLDQELRARLVYQLAMEISHQSQVAQKLQQKRETAAPEPRAQVVFCIDVRSEMIRRHIESVANDIQTIGFAGFFGLGMDYRRPGEDHLGHRLPVLLRSSHIAEESEVLSPQVSQEVTAFLRNLRKNSYSSFLYVELFGVIYGLKLLTRALSRFLVRFSVGKFFENVRSRSGSPGRITLKSSTGEVMGAKEIAEKVAPILGHMGLVSEFAPLVVLLGHGSRTENNAFGSTLDCGACGGHPGDANARVLAGFLNDREVRKHLSHLGLKIPETTLFISGVHETVTDEINLVARGLTPEMASAVRELQKTLSEASKRTRNERLTARSSVPSDPAEVRSSNWSEVRPEWGLAGNACFIVAPRSRTRGISFGSRVFLHDYDWRLDEKNGFKTLELILTAPMVVTNWINLQYYASTVVPEVYGAGNKVLHNLVNETGVLEGNCGDLKFGLPMQSVHDGTRMVHEPLRLSVFVEAPQAEIERLIEKHQTVRELITNGWLHLLRIGEDGAEVFRRAPSGQYMSVTR